MKKNNQEIVIEHYSGTPTWEKEIGTLTYVDNARLQNALNIAEIISKNQIRKIDVNITIE